MSTSKSYWPGSRVDNATVYHNPSSIFGLVFHNKDTYDTVINFKLHGVDVGFDIITLTDDDKERLHIYEVTIQLIWDLRDPSHSNNDKAYQFSQGV